MSFLRKKYFLVLACIFLAQGVSLGIPRVVVHAATVLSDDFTGTTINTAKWTEADPGGIGGTVGNVRQNGALTITGTGAWGVNILSTANTYSRTAGNIALDADVTIANCAASASVPGIGYGDLGVVTGGGQSYTVFYSGGKLYLSRQNANVNEESVMTSFTCTNNTPFHVKLVVLQNQGAALYINGSGTAAATVTGGTFTDKKFFLQATVGTTTIDTVVITDTFADAPTSLVAVPSSQQVSLTWSAPATTGGSAVTDYAIEYKESASGTWLPFADGTSTATSTVVTDLTNGVPYDFRVSAVNTSGAGSPSVVATATPNTSTPGAPLSLIVVPTDSQVDLSWSVPLVDGGSAIMDYIVEYKLSSSGSWSTFSDGTSTTTAATITGLTNNSNYDFRISAVNAVGTGSPSASVSDTPYPYSLIDNFTGTTIDTSKWTEVDAGALGGTVGNVRQDGDLNITGTGVWGAAGVSTVTTYDRAAGDTSMTVTITRSSCGSGNAPVALGYGDIGFTNSGTSSYILTSVSDVWNLYYFNNGANVTSGSGSTVSPQVFSGTSSCVNGVPFRMTLTALQGGGASVYVNGSDSPSATISTGTFTNKSFWLGALNSAGTSDIDNMRIKTPIPVPYAPSELAAVAGNGQVSLSWVSQGPYAADDYLIEYKRSIDPSWSTFVDGVSTATTATVTGLTNGVSYNFRVSASNEGGTGSVSGSINMTPFSSTPTAPSASGVFISGSASVGDLLGGVYSFNDVNNNSEGTSLYRWLRADTAGGQYTAISGATSSSYQTTSNDTGKYLMFEVTPVANIIPANGTAVSSSSFGPIGAAATYVNNIVSTGQSLSVGLVGSPALSTTQP